MADEKKMCFGYRGGLEGKVSHAVDCPRLLRGYAFELNEGEKKIYLSAECKHNYKMYFNCEPTFEGVQQHHASIDDFV